MSPIFISDGSVVEGGSVSGNVVFVVVVICSWTVWTSIQASFRSSVRPRWNGVWKTGVNLIYFTVQIVHHAFDIVDASYRCCTATTIRVMVTTTRRRTGCVWLSLAGTVDGVVEGTSVNSCVQLEEFEHLLMVTFLLFFLILWPFLLEICRCSW